MAVADAPKTGGVREAQPRTGSAGEPSLIRLLTYLIPPMAGLSIGIAIETVLTDGAVLDSIWANASLDPDSVPSSLVFRAAGVAVGIVLWLISAAVIKSGGSLTNALRRAAYGFLPFLSILALNALNGVAGEDIVAWSPLAVILSLASLAAWTTVSAVTNGNRAVTAIVEGIRKRSFLMAVCVGIAYAAVSIAMGLLQYRAVMINYGDCGNFDEMLWRTLHGRLLMCSQFDHTFLGEHVEFVHLLLLPIYVLWPGLPVLMVLLGLALGSGAIAVYLLARDRLNSPVAAVLFSAAYVLYAPMQYLDKEVVTITFLPEVFYVPFMLWAVYFLVKGRMRWLLFMSFLVLSCKEEMALPVAMFGIVLAARKQWKWGLAFFAGGVAWFLLSLTVVIPYFNNAPSHVFHGEHYGHLGGSLPEIVANVLGHPLATLRLMFSFAHTDLLLMMLVPLGCLALFSPTILVIFLPSLATALLSSFQPTSAIYFHWHLSITPFPIAGAVMGAANLARILPRLGALWGRVEQQARAGLVALACGALVFTSSAAFDVVYGKMPWSLMFYNSHSNAYWRYLYTRTPEAKVFLTKVLPSIPRDASVTATMFFATRFTHYASMFKYPYGLDTANYVVVQQREAWDNGTAWGLMQMMSDDEQIPGFERIFSEAGVFVFKRKAAAATGADGEAAKRDGLTEPVSYSGET